MKSPPAAPRGLRVLAVASSAVLFGIVVFRAQTGCVEPSPPAADVGPDPAVSTASPPSDVAPTPTAPANDGTNAVATPAPADAGGEPAPSAVPPPPNEPAGALDPSSPSFFPGSKSGGFLRPIESSSPTAPNSPNQTSP